MSIVLGIMVPHPPIIMSEVGGGEEKKIQKTIDSYRQAAEAVADFSPDTIVISSPHTTMYADYFHISPGGEASGDMSAFRAGNVKFKINYDKEFVDKLCLKADAAYFPAGTMGEREKRLDHGVMIPLYFLRQTMDLSDVNFVRVGLSGMPYKDHYRLGMMIRDVSNELGRRTVFIASGDLSHKLKDHGPYGFVKEGPVYDERIMDVMGRGAFKELFDFDEKFCDKAAECGHRSFIIMAGAFDGTDVDAKALSHEGTFGVGYGVCTFTPLGVESKREFLDILNGERLKVIKEQRKNEDLWVRIARTSLETYIRKRERIDGREAFERFVTDYGTAKGEEKYGQLESELLQKEAGAFVSLHKDGMLRGCIGTFLPTQDCVADELCRNAICAATEDPRFSPVRADELDFIEYSVDVLGTPEDIPDSSYLDPKRYGVIVRSGMKRGLLLPDLEGVDTVEEQIDIAKRKAGIGRFEAESLQRFEVVRHL